MNIDLPFVGVTETLETCIIFSIGPLHVFYLGIYRMLTQCMCDMLLSNDMLADLCGKGKISMETFYYMKKNIIKKLSRLMIDKTSTTDGWPPATAVLHVDSSTGMNG